jgi:glycogen synthase
VIPSRIDSNHLPSTAIHSNTTAFHLHRKPSVTHFSASIQFSGQHWQGTGKNGLWVSLELAPYSVVGGLGQVTETIPEALNGQLQKDIRVMVPLLSGMAQSSDFQPNGWEVTLPIQDGKTEHFRLFQRNIPGKPIVYAIENETYFGKHKNIYFKQSEHPEGIGEDAIFKAVMVFNRAAAVFTEKLTEASKAKQTGQPYVSGPALYEGPLEFALVHDWLTSPFLKELSEETRDGLGKLFMLHNTYNEARPLEVAKASLMKTDDIQVKAKQNDYSPLTIGIESADAVIGNRNYTRRIAEVLNPTARFTPALKQKLSEGKVFDMHHGLSERYTPFQNPFLSADGFVSLNAKTVQPYLKRSLSSHPKAAVAALKEIQRFKRTNKLALQKQLGLPENPQAPIFSWVARPEPYQKGFYLVLNTLVDFLKQHPDAQAILAGPQPGQGNAQIDAFLDQFKADPELSKRIAVRGHIDFSSIVRIHAGSDFLMHPSLYEPYGLSQLEAMTLGSVPIVNLVDGLKSTISDPRQNRKRQLGQCRPSEKETVWQYGQNGIAMEAFSPLSYWKGLDAVIKGIPAEARSKKAQTQLLSEYKRANQGFLQALDRAYTTHQDPEKMAQWRLNGMRFVNQQHQWQNIAPRYETPIESALKAADERRAQKLKQPQFA